MKKIVLTILCFGLSLSALAACGKKGGPDLPPGTVEDTYNSKYPSTTEPQSGVFN